jgi:hypothetical protein
MDGANIKMWTGVGLGAEDRWPVQPRRDIGGAEEVEAAARA